MRILHINDTLSGRGGAGQHLLAELDGLVKMGHDVHLAVSATDGSAKAPCPTLLVEGLGARERVLFDTRMLEAVEADVIHLHNAMNPAVLEWAATRRSVLTVHDHRFFCPGRGKLTLAGAVCRSPMHADRCRHCFKDPGYSERIRAITQDRLAALRGLCLVVLSNYMKQELTAAGLPAEQIHVSPPFVHGVDAHAEPDGPPCILFAGRLVEAKGVKDAISAWRQSAVNLPLVFAGTGRLRNELERLGFEVTGWLDRTELSRMFARAREVLFPPRWQEPFGIVGLEALHCGVPVVAWESGGISQWHPDGKRLVSWGDVGGLARALHKAVGLRATARPGFDRNTLMQALVDLYGLV